MAVHHGQLSARRRLDVELVRRGLTQSRSLAQQLIEEGKVLVGGAQAGNSARQVGSNEPIRIAGPGPRFVSRGGEKLAGALQAFGVDVVGKKVIDVGSSTGGFTDCLLQHGAQSVVAVDVGRNQLHEHLRADHRVEIHEQTNIRDVAVDDLGGERFEMVTVDVSFTSVKGLAPRLVGDLAAEGADVIVLVKPQFEAGRRVVSKGRGVVKDPETWKEVLISCISAFEVLGAATMGTVISPLRGADGNVEFFTWFRAHDSSMTVGTAAPADVDEAIRAAVADRPSGRNEI